MLKAYRVKDETTGNVMLSFCALDDESAVRKAKQMYPEARWGVYKHNGDWANLKWSRIG